MLLAEIVGDVGWAGFWIGLGLFGLGWFMQWHGKGS